MSNDWLIVDPWIPVQAPRTNGSDYRSPGALAEVLAQFDVVNTPRYKKRDLTADGQAETFCNIFVSDATKALACEVPHWWLRHELDVDQMMVWLQRAPAMHGWGQQAEEVARLAANKGQPVIAVWPGHMFGGAKVAGHIAMLMPTPAASIQPRCAAAGATNVFDAPLSASFGVDFRQHPMMYFVHA